MLIDFEVENFRSYRESKKFSLVASAAKELPGNLIHLADGDISLLRTAALYGPNASGKSNLLIAMGILSEIVEAPTARGLMGMPLVGPFALDRDSRTKPTRFQVRFKAVDVLYEYSISFRADEVEEERLVALPLGRPQIWFERKGRKIEFGSNLKGPKQSLASLMAPGSAFLAVAAAFGHPHLLQPAIWLTTNLRTRFDGTRGVLGFGPSGRRRYSGPDETAKLCYENESFREWASAFLRHADLGIQGIEIRVTETKQERPVVSVGPGGTRTTASTVVTEARHHPFFVHGGEDGVTVLFGMPNESQGTRRLFSMLPTLYDVLGEGQVAIIDELSASIHPSLVRELMRIFHDPELNPRGAQLIFATHDTSLLSGRLFRRDQVWFTEKDSVGATDLYSLQDIKGVREDEAFEKGYLRGRYGAIPFFGQFDFPPIADESADKEAARSDSKLHDGDPATKRRS